MPSIRPCLLNKPAGISFGRQHPANPKGCVPTWPRPSRYVPCDSARCGGVQNGARRTYSTLPAKASDAVPANSVHGRRYHPKPWPLRPGGNRERRREALRPRDRVSLGMGRPQNSHWAPGQRPGRIRLALAHAGAGVFIGRREESSAWRTAARAKPARSATLKSQTMGAAAPLPSSARRR